MVSSGAKKAVTGVTPVTPRQSSVVKARLLPDAGGALIIKTSCREPRRR